MIFMEEFITTTTHFRPGVVDKRQKHGVTTEKTLQIVKNDIPFTKLIVSKFTLSTLWKN
ncbi:hypothetical protein SAMN04515674_11180 [Pseudarcicella hirudinis]|uniref:Uncharacterized protein n=1 Tax=Pseudarcicella hirudinis TaxID=1079859 RepID=A0A1I5WAV1_9BACT|nr:hypothetical protein SAMN04515674_11180 [Pseudarcicella hirudinis]